jgi:glycosyltransferase involved in cell wall biosynthesis
LRRTGPDDVVVVHQEGYAAGRLTMRYAHHARCVYVMHGRGASSLPVHEAADYSVVLNDDARDEMRAMGVPDSRVRQVVPSIDRTLFGPPGRSADLGLGREQGREQVVGCLGRIDPGKGIFELPDILRALADLDVRLELVGSPTDEAVARRVDEAFAGLPVDVLGELSPEQVSARMKVWTAMVMPSYAEGMPISALEALSSGVQLVGVTGVIPRSMAQRRGALVGPRESLAERVREALTQPQETETDWIPDHSDGARTWEEIYAALPSWRPRFRPSARPLVGRLTRMRRPRWAAPSR